MIARNIEYGKMMNIVLVSNYFNHHQQPLCEALEARCDSFFFISTTVMREERKKLGYAFEQPEYVILAYEDGGMERARKAIAAADAIIYGSAVGELSKGRYYRGKNMLYYSERIYKRGCRRWLLPYRAARFYVRYQWRQRSLLLCAGAYAAYDYSRSRTFLNRCYKWGYFPEAKTFDIHALIADKQPRSLLWCGRLIDWKHPEIAVQVAARLKQDGCRFSLDIIGSGAMEQTLAAMIEQNGLQHEVRLLGSMPPQETRRHMERAEIMLLTSDRQEGWGAVLNEAMNSGCAVAASSAMGAAPFLIEDGTNGLLCRPENTDDFYGAVKRLLADDGLRRQLGTEAYRTVTGLWHAPVAAERVLAFAENMTAGEPLPVFADGPCSRAAIIKTIT